MINFENLKAKKTKYIIVIILIIIILIALIIFSGKLSDANIDSDENLNDVTTTFVETTIATSNVTTSNVTTTINTTVTNETTLETSENTTTSETVLPVTNVPATETSTPVEAKNEQPSTEAPVEVVTTVANTTTTIETSNEVVNPIDKAEDIFNDTKDIMVDVIKDTKDTLLDIESIAKEVIDGKWGSGADRKKKLTDNGYNYDEVQDKVNEIIKESKPVNSNVSLDGSNMSYVKNFTRGTYYGEYGYDVCGGSGRSLIDCSWGDGTVRGSIASSYLYSNYGYNYNGKRTMVYLEVYGCPSMTGYYYLDDCDAGNWSVIDFYYRYYSNCPFQNAGVLTSIDCYIVNY